MVAVLLSVSAYAEEADAFDIYEKLESLQGEWVLSPENKQIGTDSYKHKAVLPIVGTSATGISFKSIGYNSTIQEDLLPNTASRWLRCITVKIWSASNSKLHTTV